MIKSTIALVLSGIFLVSSMLAEDVLPEDVAFRVRLPQLYVVQNQEHVVQWARDHLPQTGVLTEDKGGFVYLKVDDDYIYKLYSMLPHNGYSKPPYFRRPDSPGAHISVFYIDERKQTGKIPEIGQKYTFSLTRFDAVPPHTHEYIILAVHAPELEKLREKYGLSPLLKNHPFHITIAKKNRIRY